MSPGMRVASAVLCGAIPAAACDTTFDCTAIEVFPIEIAPVDRSSGASIADSATAVATKNERAWPLGPARHGADGRLLTLRGGEGPGRYLVAVRHPRYVDWDSTVVVATASGCQRFVSVSFTVRMTPR